MSFAGKFLVAIISLSLAIALHLTFAQSIVFGAATGIFIFELLPKFTPAQLMKIGILLLAVFLIAAWVGR